MTRIRICNQGLEYGNETELRSLHWIDRWLASQHRLGGAYHMVHWALWLVTLQTITTMAHWKMTYDRDLTFYTWMDDPNVEVWS